MDAPLPPVSEPSSPSSYQLATDQRTTHAVNTLVDRGYVSVIDEGEENNRHIGLKCNRGNCDAVWKASANRKNAYSHMLQHVLFRHGWDAITVVQTAHMQKYAPSTDVDVNVISPPSRRYRAKRARPDDPSTPLRSSSSVGGMADPLKATALMVASSRLALRWFSLPFVREWQLAIGGTRLVGREAATDAVRQYGTETKKDTICYLAGSNQTVTVAVDSVTNVNQHKVYSVVLLSEGKAWFYCLWSIGNETDTGVAAAAKLSRIITNLQQDGVRIVAVVSDNASNMVLARSSLADEFQLLDVGCAAHLIHNSAMQLLSAEALDPLLSRFDEITKQYREDKQLRAAMQRQSVLKLQRPNDTRWSSHLAAYQRLLQQRETIDGLPPGTTRGSTITVEH